MSDDKSRPKDRKHQYSEERKKDDIFPYRESKNDRRRRDNTVQEFRPPQDEDPDRKK